jgi:hydrogenase nickel incorporation protein HypA/HybF
MHEYAVTQSIIRIAVTEAERVGAKKVTAINLVIGDLSTVVDDSVRLYFSIIAAGTSAEGAELNFRRIRAEFFCKHCEKSFVKPAHGFDCPICGNYGTPTDVGKEFYVESIEVDST